MSKIVQAVNAMIANPGLITGVIKSETEYFFLYKNKYKWSMAKREDTFCLWYYPGKESIQELASIDSFDGGHWEDYGIQMVTYRDADIGTREAKASFAELYTLLKEKLYGLNDVLDDIISDSPPF